MLIIKLVYVMINLIVSTTFPNKDTYLNYPHFARSFVKEPYYPRSCDIRTCLCIHSTRTLLTYDRFAITQLLSREP